MDEYFRNQQRQIEDLNNKLDTVLELLANQSKNDQEEYVQANYLQTLIDLPWNEYTKDDFNLKRAERILVEGVDRDGNPLRFEAEGMLAIVIQHELDHLEGTLFIDHVSALKRQMYKRKVKKEMKKR